MHFTGAPFSIGSVCFRFVFGIPGEENLEIMKALHHSKIRFITTRHEQGAAFMADVYGRLTGKAGVCLSTLGPGATNLVTGVADANSDGAPLIAITGQVGTERMHLTSHQYLDLVGMFEPITKRSKQIVRPDTTNEIVRIAFKYAESEKPGASYIDLPCDIAAMEVPEGPGRLMLTHHRAALELPDEDSVAQAASMIREAKHPLILAGHSAVRNNASGALRMFADKLSVPVVTTMMAKGVVPDSDQNCVGTIGIPETDYPDKALAQADLVIAVGYDIVEFAPRKWNGDSSHRIIHIDERATHVNKLYQPEIEVIGDISACLEKIAEQCSPCPEPLWAYNIRRERLEDAGRFTDDVSYPVKPQKVISDIRRILADDDILLCDVGAHKMWVARDYPCEEPKTCIISNGFATMGIAVPGAVAAKLIYPDKKILAVTGDGGFLMNCQELETAVRIGTNFVTLIFHDGSYGLIKWRCRFRQPGFCKACGKLRLQGLPDQPYGGSSPGARGCVPAEGTVCYRLPCGLPRESEAIGAAAGSYYPFNVSPQNKPVRSPGGGSQFCGHEETVSAPPPVLIQQIFVPVIHVPDYSVILCGSYSDRCVSSVPSIRKKRRACQFS